jgi:hypothetical protein
MDTTWKCKKIGFIARNFHLNAISDGPAKRWPFCELWILQVRHLLSMISILYVVGEGRGEKRI